MILRRSVSSAVSHIALSVGELFLWKPTLTALRKNDYSWSRWAAFVNPHHAEEEYWSFEMTVTWNTVCSDWSSNPCDLRTRSTYNDWKDELLTDETCSCIEKLLHSVTPMIFREFTRCLTVSNDLLKSSVCSVVPPPEGEPPNIL